MNKRVLSACRFLCALIISCLFFLSGCGKNIMNRKNIPIEENFSIYSSNGKCADLNRILKMSESVDVVLIGEMHNDRIAHYLEKWLIEHLYKKFQKPEQTDEKRKIILSLEMLETDTQMILDEYLADIIPKRHFLASSRVWPDFTKDYLPLIEFSKANKIPVIAGNAPRRYVNLVSRKGRDSLDLLSDIAKTWIAPLPYHAATKTYKEKIDMLNRSFEKEHEGKKIKNKKMAEAVKNKIKKGVDHNAQSLWDATMAWSISKALRKNPQSLLININGRFHSEENLGIPEHLKEYMPYADIMIITIFPDENYREFKEEFKSLGDFIILTNPKFSESESSL